jgi:hypothetical protein
MEGTMERMEFAALSLYTGPANLKPIVNDPACPWVVGQWNGLNNGLSSEEIKKDIDGRIAFLIDSFKAQIPKYKVYQRYFVVPEFFFHCQQGPYPYIQIAGQYPVAYIRSRLEDELRRAIPLHDTNQYTLVAGSILTSNIEDYPAFLKSEPVLERQKQLQALLPRQANNLKHAGHAAWRRSLPVQEDKDNGKALSAEQNALNDFMLECRANPLCTVRNRGIYIHYQRNGSALNLQSYVYEKQNESTVDLTMGVLSPDHAIQHGGMITEWMANYPSYSIIQGDKQTNRYMTNARFMLPHVSNYDVGVEICLDHRLQRLRRTVDMSKKNGANADNFPLCLQLVPSGGMQLLSYSVSADKNSPMFNADGCDKIYLASYGDENSVVLNGEPGPYQGITCGVYTNSVQSKWTEQDNTYYAHSQLAFSTQDSAVDGFNNALGVNNKPSKTFDGPTARNPLTDSFKPSITRIDYAKDLFAITRGELHYYEPI